MQLPKKHQKLTVPEVVALCRTFGRHALADRIETNPPITLFASDGASAFPDRIGDVDLYQAAFWHDVAYWLGGSVIDRFVADCKLTIDVVRNYTMPAGEIKLALIMSLAVLMFLGVRIGGCRWLPLPWRWGFGNK